MPTAQMPATALAALQQGRRLLYVGVMASILLVILAAALATQHLRQAGESRDSAATQNLVRAVDLGIESMIDMIDVVLLTSADEISRQLADRGADPDALTRFLERQRSRVSVAAYLRATNARGDLVFGPGVEAQPTQVADRDYFIQLRDTPGAGLLVVKPVVGRLSGKWVWTFARRIEKPDGSFAGVVFAAVYVHELERQLAQIGLDPGGSIALRHLDLGMVARFPPAASINIPVGDRHLPAPFEEALEANRMRGTYVSGTTAHDPVSRQHAYQRNAKYGFLVNVGVPVATGLRGWHRQAAVVLGLAMAFIIAALTFTLLLRRAWQRQEADVAALEDSRQALDAAQRIAGLGSYRYDLQTRRWSSSAVLDDIFGIEPAASHDIAQWLELVEPPSRGEMAAYLTRIIEQGLPFDHEYAVVRPADGRRRWVHGKGELEFDDNGKPLVLHGTIQDITERDDLENALMQRNRDLQALYKSIQMAREGERQRLARELHDDLGHRLTVLRMDLEWATAHLEHAPPGVEDRLAAIGAQIDDLADAVRRLTEDMRPGMLSPLGLVAALEDYVAKFARRSGIACEFMASDDDIRVADDIAIGIYRIVQESTNNVLRHAAARHVKVRLERKPGLLALTVEDDGNGMPATTDREVKGFGLLGMRERVALMNGHLSIDSQPGRGVRIEVSIPMPV